MELAGRLSPGALLQSHPHPVSLHCQSCRRHRREAAEPSLQSKHQGHARRSPRQDHCRTEGRASCQLFDLFPLPSCVLRGRGPPPTRGKVHRTAKLSISDPGSDVEVCCSRLMLAGLDSKPCVVLHIACRHLWMQRGIPTRRLTTLARASASSQRSEGRCFEHSVVPSDSTAGRFRQQRSVKQKAKHNHDLGVHRRQIRGGCEDFLLSRSDLSPGRSKARGCFGRSASCTSSSSQDFCSFRGGEASRFEQLLQVESGGYGGHCISGSSRSTRHGCRWHRPWMPLAFEHYRRSASS